MNKGLNVSRWSCCHVEILFRCTEEKHCILDTVNATMQASLRKDQGVFSASRVFFHRGSISMGHPCISEISCLFLIALPTK